MKREQDYKQLEIQDDTGQPPAWQKIIRPDGRIVWNPNSALREEQETIYEWVDSVAGLKGKGNTWPHAHGGVKERNIMTNALPHSGNRFFFQVDFADAYGQVDLTTLGYKLADFGGYGTMKGMPRTGKEASELLAATCKPPEADGLAQGGLASPILFNLYCMELDEELAAYCRTQGISYTRFLDDLTFSSPDSGYSTFDRIGKAKRRAIREIIAKHGLSLNEAKTRVKDKAKAPVIVTGLQINRYGKIQLTASYLREARRNLREMTIASTTTKDLLEYASGLNGLLRMTIDHGRHMTEEERKLYIEVRDVIDTYGKTFDF